MGQKDAATFNLTKKCSERRNFSLFIPSPLVARATRILLLMHIEKFVHDRGYSFNRFKEAFKQCTFVHLSECVSCLNESIIVLSAKKKVLYFVKLRKKLNLTRFVSLTIFWILIRSLIVKYQHDTTEHVCY